MARVPYQQTLQALSKLEFTDKGESFVEQRFVTPLLECLGYETHKDYEVIHHGDDGSAFKLRHPPVEMGALRDRTYIPDYVPTIRKKMFWIIEAKSPKRKGSPLPSSATELFNRDQQNIALRKRQTTQTTVAEWFDGPAHICLDEEIVGLGSFFLATSFLMFRMRSRMRKLN
jgi:hypothetical protein